MKKAIVFLIIFCILLNSVALKVAVDEIKTDSIINFINYVGPYGYQDTVFSIRAIGTNLARVENDNEQFNYLMKYSIIHAVNDATNDKFDADIFSIEREARVDHIRNVRMIISSYLERRYGYNRNDAYILATFITYYNAIYRGNVEYFAAKYKDVVLKHINSANAGISTKYFEWPGATKLIIPLTEFADDRTISSLKTDELTDEKVIEKLKRQEDKGIEDREKITDLKDREVKEEKKVIEKEKVKIEQEKKEIANEEKEIEKEKAKVAKIEDPEEKAKKEAAVKEKEKAVDEKKEEVKKDEEKVKKDEEAVLKKEKTVKKEKEEIKEDKTTVAIKKEPEKAIKELEKKSTELEKKEEELKKKEEELKNKGISENVYLDKFYYLRIKEYMKDGHYNNEMFIIDAITRKVVLKSPVEKICGSRFDIFKDGVVVITYISDHNSAHYLTLLDLNTLEPKITGKDNIFWRSFVEINNDSIYAIIKEKDDYFLGKFNSKMELIAKSKEEVDNSTFITFYKDFIYINGEKKKDILILNNKDLTMAEKIVPSELIK